MKITLNKDDVKTKDKTCLQQSMTFYVNFKGKSIQIGMDGCDKKEEGK